MSLSVEHTVELERIRALPRRVLTAELAQEWAAYLTTIFALRPDVALLPWQGMALAEAVACRGAWLAMPVGLGKTLISALLPLAMRAQRACLIVPGALEEKTRTDLARYVGVWRMSTKPLLVLTRERLSVIAGEQTLEEYRPDLIVIDEADMLANASSSTARKIDRYVGNHEVCVVAMSGTPSRKSIMGYWHLLAWCLGDGAPIPLIESEARMWASAIDDHRGARPSPGPLGSSVDQACAWYRRRLIETPGVVVVDEDSCDAPLTLRVRLAQEDPILDAAFASFLIEQESPGGIPVSDPLSRWRLDGQLGLGLYSRWDPPPPEAWRKARRAVSRFVRDRILSSTRSHRPLDTEAQVLRRYPTHGIVADWLEQKPLFAGHTETVWISRSTLDSCHAWLRELDAPGIVWCGSVDFGEALAREAGLLYYGPKGRSSGGSMLHAPPSKDSMVVSWNANLKGFNLQSWPRQLITMPPQSAKWLEQIFGRSHRKGQREHVVVDVLATSGGTLDLFECAIREAEKVRERESLTQKILRADIVRAHPTITTSNEFRWTRRDST